MEMTWLSVYCDPDFTDEVMAELKALKSRLDKEHPEYKFDMDNEWDDGWTEDP